jgi:hypothetical protein
MREKAVSVPFISRFLWTLEAPSPFVLDFTPSEHEKASLAATGSLSEALGLGAEMDLSVSLEGCAQHPGVVSTYPSGTLAETRDRFCNILRDLRVVFAWTQFPNLEGFATANVFF